MFRFEVMCAYFALCIILILRIFELYIIFCSIFYGYYYLAVLVLFQGFQLEIPSRAASNQIYVPELDRIVLGGKRGTRSFLNVKVFALDYIFL